MKLPKGRLKVITFATDAILQENERRVRAGGKIFHPTVYVAIEPGKNEPPVGRMLAGFGLVLPADAQVKSCITNFPYVWAGRRDIPRYWIETTDVVELQTSIEETK